MRKPRPLLALAGLVAIAASLVVIAVVLLRATRLGGQSGKGAHRAGSAAPLDAFTPTHTMDGGVVRSFRADRVHVDESMEVDGALTALTLTANGISLPAEYVPEAPDDLATMRYVRSSRPNAGAVPSGTIILWLEDYPPGAPWVRCDGKNGTPDLTGRLLKGVRGITEANAMGGAGSQRLTEEHLPTHDHGGALGEPTWERAGQGHEHETTEAGAHSHDITFHAGWNDLPVLPSPVIKASFAPMRSPLLVRTAARNTVTGNATAFTPLDSVQSTTSNVSMQLNPANAAWGSGTDQHAHTVMDAHTHAVTQAGTDSAALAIMPGRIHAGFYIKL